IRICDTTTGDLKANLEGHTETVNAVAFSSNGRLIASASNEQTVRLWHVAAGA
ncbi:hypothetical protein LZ31DRAFT_448200, partial [Colletotrichum somersetense]